ncbi:MAG: Shikimate dehydrogenase (NADP(+)) [Verrucomicrobia subdivision 3 bacterium]|nr:Shikimate dehydrogenase (NADP(+)) [Limisphaerales bacterium]MCS1416488.1 Shikimate dehydrogenase (NADP(+)) [Limisphaerales bacterium]
MGKVWNFKQELTGAFGKPIAENPTQYMIEAAFRYHGLEWRYLSLEVDPSGLEDAVKGARVMGFRGFNCTIPHKVAVIEYLDGLGESAELMEAVNCVVRREDKLIGENTDGKGFVQSLKELREPVGSDVVILGAGGAARAISVEMALMGATRITIVNRSQERGEPLVDLLSSRVKVATDFVPWTGDFKVPETTNILINATSIGLFPDVDARVALDESTLRSNLVVADVIPNPPSTRLIQAAREAGCQVIDGKRMLVNQGVLGFKYWTGVDANPAVMHKALGEVFDE